MHNPKRIFLVIFATLFAFVFIFLFGFGWGFLFNVAYSDFKEGKIGLASTPRPMIVGSRWPARGFIRAPLNYEIPLEWLTYKRRFQEVEFQFKYPKEASLFDSDESSGDIYLVFDPVHSRQTISIGRLIYYGFPEYSGGPDVITWFLKEYYANHGPVDSHEFAFAEFEVDGSDKKFYQVFSNTPVTGIPSINSNKGYFIGVLDGIAVVVNVDAVEKDIVYKLLQTLEVKK